MRSLRSFVVPVCLSLFLGASAASAAEGPSRHARREETGGVAVRIVRDIQALLTAAWENEGFQIDPWGRTSQGNGGPVQEDPATPGADEGFEIDPWG